MRIKYNFEVQSDKDVNMILDFAVVVVVDTFTSTVYLNCNVYWLVNISLFILWTA